MAQVYNFSSGPAMLPAEVLKLAQQELCDWHGLGTSVMEISHRGKEFIQVAEEAEQDFRSLLNIPSNYKVLFCHGGGRGQFAGIPLNILGAANAYFPEFPSKSTGRKRNHEIAVRFSSRKLAKINISELKI